MQKNIKVSPLALIVFLVILVWILWGVQDVPVATSEFEWYRYSFDLEKTLTDPLSISDSPFTASAEDYRHRLQYQPLPKYLFGILRLVMGYPQEQINALNPVSDEANTLVFWGRIFNAVLYGGGIFLVYLITRKLAGELAGIIAMIFLGTNAVLLLYLRMVSGDALQIFLLAAFILSLVYFEKESILQGILLGLLASTQIYWLLLAPVGLLVLIWQNPKEERSLQTILTRTLSYVISLVICFLALNPLFWKTPRLTIPASFEKAAPAVHQIPGRTDTTSRLMNSVLAVFIDEPDVSYAANYSELSAAGQIYLSNPSHVLFRGVIGGSIMALLSILGVGAILASGFSKQARLRIILVAASLGIVLLSFVFNPGADQALYLPVILISCVWAGSAIGYPLVEKEVLKPKTESFVSFNNERIDL